MKKNDTIIYNIYTHTACLFMFKEEYEQLLNPIIEYARTTKQPCDIFIDTCKYSFADQTTLADDLFPNIHIIITGQGTSKIERIVKKSLSQNGFYKHFDKYSIEDDELASSHIELLEQHSTRQDRIKVTYRDKKKVVSIAYQDAIDI